MWKKKILRNLGLCTTLFAVLTIYLLTLINSDDNLSTHDHEDDILILQGNDLSYYDNVADEADLPGTGLNNYTENKRKLVKITDEKSIPSFDIQNNKSSSKVVKKKHKTARRDVDIELAVNNSNIAELSHPWETKIGYFADPMNYKLPGEDFEEGIPDSVLLQRMNSIRCSMKLCWSRYKECAWGSDKLHPDSCAGSTWFGLGLTIIDSLDTLFLMGMKEEYNEAVEFVSNINYREGSDNVNLFEITIRILGAFLTLLHFTKNQLFLSKAVELGDLLIDSGAFNTKSGVPLSDINLSTGGSHMPTCSGCSRHSSLSEVTTLQLEFSELTRVTGDFKYKEATDRAMSAVFKHLPTDGLPRNYVDVTSGATTGTLTLGARGDSYYEYLLKQWIQSREQRYWEEYNKAVISIKKKLVFSSQRNLTYIAEITDNNKVNHKMDHLVCFLPGTLALGTYFGAPAWHLDLAEEIVRSCVEMYNTQSGLAPEIVKFDKTSQLYTSSMDEFSLLRPETVESLFILWRVTHKTKYRAWAWDIYSSMERSARHPTYGFSSMEKIKSKKPRRKGHLESFFLAETLKYLYLIHGPDDIVPIHRYVFNTEAHPLPIDTQFFKRSAKVAT